MEIFDLRSRAKALLHRSEISISALPTHTEMLHFPKTMQNLVFLIHSFIFSKSAGRLYVP